MQEERKSDAVVKSERFRRFLVGFYWDNKDAVNAS